jgi:IS30 family transposase
MTCRARLSGVTELPVYCAHPHSPWEGGTDEDTNGLVREQSWGT